MNNPTPLLTPKSPCALLHANLARSLRQSQSPIAAEHMIGARLQGSMVAAAIGQLQSLHPYQTVWTMGTDSDAIRLIILVREPFPSALRDLYLLDQMAHVVRSALGISQWSLLGSDDRGVRVQLSESSLAVEAIE